jgi:hypothetical protein
MAQARGRYISDPGPRFDEAKEQAVKSLVRAANEWAEGNPLMPDPAVVLEEIIDVFAKAKFIRRPYGSGP